MAANETSWKDHTAIAELVSGLQEAVGDRLLSVVLYGPAARGESSKSASDLHVLLVLGDLSLATLVKVGAPLTRWMKRGLPVPRLFSPATLAEAADVFPIELGDIAERHVLIHGKEPLPSMPEIDREHLRLQCERELREKMMRLEEAYAISRGQAAELRRLMVTSFPAFAMVFRGCLRLQGGRVPEGTLEASEAFCRAAGIDAAPFQVAWNLRKYERSQPDEGDFGRYHAALERSIDAIDKFVPTVQASPVTTRSES